MDTPLGNQNNASIDECSNNSCTSTSLFCHSSCFCSAASRVDSGTISATKSDSTTTEIPVSSYSQLGTSTSSESSSEHRAKSEASDDMVDDSADTVFASSESRVMDASSDGRIKPASSSESRVASDITVTLDESSEEFFTDVAAIDVEDALDDGHLNNTVVSESKDSSQSLMRKSSSTSELMAISHCR